VLVAATTNHLFWITSRAAGTVALALASLSVCVGLAMGGRLIPQGGRDLRTTHEALSLATMAALALHALSLLGDSYLRPSLADVTLPFVSSYREPWMTIGILAGWLTALLGLSYYLRGRIGVRRWRTLHRFTALAWLLGIVHALGEGTDVGAIWFLAPLALVVVPALVLLVIRILGDWHAAPPEARRA
jgi:methionine sulfoxide reductase heme-binding subunit